MLGLNGYCVVLPIIRRHYDKRLVYLSRFLCQSPPIAESRVQSRLVAHPTPLRHETHITYVYRRFPGCATGLNRQAGMERSL